MITRIEIEGYKSIRKSELSLMPINILIGSNGVGKSNFISLFTLIRNIHNQNLQNYILKKGGLDNILFLGRKNTNIIDFKVFFRNSEGFENSFETLLETGQENLFIKSTRTGFNSNGNWHTKDYEKDVVESKFSQRIEGQSFYVNQLLQDFDVYHFHDTSDTSPMKSLSDLQNNKRLKNDGSNIASYLYYLKVKEPKHFKRIELIIKSIAPFFDYFYLEPSKLNNQVIQLEWREKGNIDTNFNAYHLSDGTLRFICLTTLLLQPNPPSTIIIDEPELGLHPVAVNKLSELIKKASQKSQVIISTQSINLIDNFEPDDIIVTERINGGTVFRRLERENLEIWLEEYTLGDLWGQNKIGAQPYSV